MEAFRACINGSRNADNGCADVGADRQVAESAGNRGGIVAVVVLKSALIFLFSVNSRFRSFSVASFGRSDLIGEFRLFCLARLQARTRLPK